MNIEITREQRSNFSKREIIRIINLVFQATNSKHNPDLGVVITTSRRMKQLNQQYRRKKKSAAVLTFVYLEDAGVKQNSLVVPKQAANFLGEVFLSPRDIARRAKKQTSTYPREFTRLLVHGVLHLLGFGHETKAREREMVTKEEKIMNKVLG